MSLDLDHDGLGLTGVAEVVAGEDLPLQAAEERLLGGAIEAPSDPAHRLADLELAAQPGERVRGVGPVAAVKTRGRCEKIDPASGPLVAAVALSASSTRLVRM